MRFNISYQNMIIKPKTHSAKERTSDIGVYSYKWDICITFYPKAQGTSQKRGQKEYKSQSLRRMRLK